MKNLLYILILANILYFVWQRSDSEPPEAGVMLVRESEMGPMLAATATKVVEPAASIGAVLGSGDPSELAAVVGKTCVSVGPFTVQADAESVRQTFDDNSVQSALRVESGQIFVGHWVQIRDIPDTVTGRRMLKTLKDGGLSDAYLVPTEEEGIKISLGVFGERDRAERIARQVNSLGLTPDISDRNRDGAVFFVDLGLPPGQDTAAMIEEYGEESVLQREQASCPRIAN